MDTNQDRLPIRGDGVYEAGVNDVPNSTGIILQQRDAAPSGTLQTLRQTAIPGEDDSVNADVALHHSNGDNITELNPFPVRQVNDPDISTDAHETNDIGPAATGSFHIFAPTGRCTIKRVQCSASDAWRADVEISRAGGAYTSVRRFQASAADKTAESSLGHTLFSGDFVRVTKVNRTSGNPNNIFSIYSAIDFSY